MSINAEKQKQGLISDENDDRHSQSKRQQYKSPFASYFLVVLLSFGVLSMLFNSLLTHSDPSIQHQEGAGTSALHIHLQNSVSDSNNAAQLDPADDTTNHKLAGLNCTRYGGPVDTRNFVYWQDIPHDSLHISPFHRKRKGHTSREEYLTFEPDKGGWNNIRMAMETILALAFAMGRTLVLPPDQKLYLLTQKKKTRHSAEQKAEFSFDDFFHMESIHNEHDGLDIITMEEFLKREAGNFRDPQTNQIVVPPGNRTDFNGDPETIFSWLRKYSHNVVWKPDQCLAVFPADASDAAVDEMKKVFKQMIADDPHFEQYIGKPVPVDAPTLDRLKESRAERSEMCLYDQKMQAAPYLHFPVDHKLKARLLVYPYQFLFFQDYREDLWMKRFIRYVYSYN